MPAGTRVIREWIPAGERGMLNAVFSGGSYAGPAVCALVAGPIIAGFGWRALFFVTGSVGIIWLICWQVWFAKPEEATWLGDTERQKIIAERGAPKVDFDSDGEKPGLLKLLGSGPSLWGVALTQGCNVYSQYLFLTWLPSYLQSSRGLTIITTGVYVAIPYLIAVGLCIVTGRLSDRLLRGGCRRWPAPLYDRLRADARRSHHGGPVCPERVADPGPDHRVADGFGFRLLVEFRIA